VSQRFRSSDQDPFLRPSAALPAVTVSARVALSLRTIGAAGEAWLADLPGLLAGLTADWTITVGARLDGGRTAYVAEVTTSDGTPAVLKVSIPPGVDESSAFDRQLAALQCAGGDPYVRLLRHDQPRRALLLERLGRPMAALGWPAAHQLEALARTAARGWRPVPDHVRLPGADEAARWHAAFIPSMWKDLARPCSEAAVTLAVRCAAAREAAFDPDRAVLVHGDVHAFNSLQRLGSPPTDRHFRLVDPGGLRSEPAHDLGVIQARGVPGRLDDLAAGESQQALEKVIASCRRTGRITGADPEAVWHWAYTEMVSTGLHVLRLGDHAEARAFLAVADKLAAAAAATNLDQAWKDHPTTSPQIIREGRRTGSHRRPGAALDDARPSTARLFLMVGLPGAGKTTRAKELAAAHRALRLTPDEWMISLFGEPEVGGKRDVLEGQLIAVARRALQLGTNVVLDFGLWSRDERSALRWLATEAGATCQVIYLPVDKEVQRARIAHRQATAPHTTFPMTEADIDQWRTQFQAPDATELSEGEPSDAEPSDGEPSDGEAVPEPPPGWSGWSEWAADRWPSLATSYASTVSPAPPPGEQTDELAVDE
jgi:streptomycin 6-kinase